MKVKKIWIIGGGCLLLLAILAAVVFMLLPEKYSQKNIVVTLQTDFDNWSGLRFFTPLGKIHSDGSEDEVSVRDVTARDGTVILGDGKVRGANLGTLIREENAIYTRWKVVGEKNCHALTLAPEVNTGPGQVKTYPALALGGCSYGGATLTAQDDGIDRPVRNDQEGMLVFEPEKWIEAVIWVKRDTQPQMVALIWEKDNPQVYSLLKSSFPEYPKSGGGYLFAYDIYDGAVAVDSFKIISKGIEDFLWFNSPPFKERSQEFLDFFNRPLPDVYAISQQTTRASSDQSTLSPSPEPTIAPTTIPTATPTEEPELKLSDYFNRMVAYEDLPQEYRFYPLKQSVFISGDEVRFYKTFLQGPTSTMDGGLWITNVMTLQKDPFDEKNDLLQSVNFDLNREQLRADVPETGDFTLSFFRNPFERYVFAKGPVSVDFYCNSLFTGQHRYCKPENLAALSQQILSRLPETESSLPKIELENFNGLEHDAKDHFDYFDLEDINHLDLKWGVRRWLPSLSFALYHQELEQFLLYEEILDISAVKIGEGETSIYPGNAGDRVVLPAGNYTLYVLVDGKPAVILEFNRNGNE